MYALYNSFIGNFPAKSEGICLGICLQKLQSPWGKCAFVQHLAFSEAMRCALLTAEAMPTGKLCCCCRKRSQLATRLTLYSRTCSKCHVATEEDFPLAGFCGSGRFERNNWIGGWGWGPNTKASGGQATQRGECQRKPGKWRGQRGKRGLREWNHCKLGGGALISIGTFDDRGEEKKAKEKEEARLSHQRTVSCSSAQSQLLLDKSQRLNNCQEALM